VRSLLGFIQESFNEALLNEKQNVPEHVDHPPFHFDYVDSSVPNALAFRYEGYSFIGITSALTDMLWDVCVRLSKSEDLVTHLGRLPVADRNNLHVVLFRTLLKFVVAHEFTHHVHGHLSRRASDSLFSNEILVGSETGSLEHQTLESDADGYAAYHVLEDLIAGEARESTLTLLKLEAEPTNVQDQVLFSCFVISVGAYLFVRPAPPLDKAVVYTLTHPPQAARMSCLMEQAIGWCKQNRPDLEAWMTLLRFQRLMNSVAQATWEIHGGRDWAQQTAFLLSEGGSEYFRKLNESLKGFIQSL
jgi:hypothetical protein